MRRNTLIATILFLAFLAFTPSIATACSCMAPDMGLVDESIMIVSGFFKETSPARDRRFNLIVVETVSCWKGEAPSRIVFMSSGDEGTCGFRPMEGESREFVFFITTESSLSEGDYSLGICNVHLKSDLEAIGFLGEIGDPKAVLPTLPATWGSLKAR